MSGSEPRSLRAGTNGVLLVLAAGVLACGGGVPEPGFVTPLDSATPAQIRAYVDDLKFDEHEGASDERALIVGCPTACKAGPVVAIQPELRTYKNSAKDLAGSPGRIIARLINRDQKQGYPVLNLGPSDTVYWAVDQLKPVSKVRSEGRSLFISAQGLRGEHRKIALTQDLYTHDYPDHPYKQALARWIPDSTSKDEDDAPGGSVRTTRGIIALTSWNNCTSGSCCR
jgi:(2Fe-2S) ferredoxin